MPAATIRDVARSAGVSIASVSRALNGAPSVHPDTRQRVTAAAKTLGYVPHAGARSLSTARNHAVGVILPDLHGEFFSEVVRGLDLEASARGYQLLLSNIHADAGLAAQAIRAMRGRVDALVVMAPQVDADALAGALAGDVPTVLLNSAAAERFASLRVDNAGGAAAMTRHLARRGRRRIVHIAGDDANLDARERIAGYRAGLEGLPAQVIAGDFQEASGAMAVRGLLAAGVALDAIFAANDAMALGAFHALREAGIEVPGAIAVAGFDDVPLARYLGLTTVHVDIQGLGVRAAARVLDAVGGGGLGAGVETVGTSLAIRWSSGGEATS